jgi:hypothetical protein
MRAHESRFAPPQSPFGVVKNPTLMVRSGQTGASAELLSQAQQAEIDRRCEAELAAIGSDFPYAEIFEVVNEAAA